MHPTSLWRLTAVLQLFVATIGGCARSEPGDSYTCDDARVGGVQCVEVADGSVWEVSSVAVVSDNEFGQAGVVLLSSLDCPYVSDSEPQYSDRDVCAMVDVFGGRNVTEELHRLTMAKWGMSSGLVFDLESDGSVPVDRSSGGLVYQCSHVNESWDGPVPVGEVSPLSGGSFTIVESNTTQAIVEIDFPDAKARLTARYCEEEAE